MEETSSEVINTCETPTIPREVIEYEEFFSGNDDDITIGEKNIIADVLRKSSRTIKEPEGYVARFSSKVLDDDEPKSVEETL